MLNKSYNNCHRNNVMGVILKNQQDLWPLAFVHAHSLWRGLCPEKLVKLKLNTLYDMYTRNEGLLTLFNRRQFLRFIYIFRIENNQNCPKQWNQVVYWSRESSSTVDLHVLGTSVIITETSSVQRTFEVTISKFWISLLLKWKWLFYSSLWVGSLFGERIRKITRKGKRGELVH